MKKSLLFFLLAISQLGFSQDRFFKMDACIGSAMTFGKVNSFGISAATEPKFFINPNWAVGLRLEGNVLFGGKIKGSTGDVSVNMSSRVAYTVKGEYYLGEKNTRPFFGLMAGYYTQATIGAGSAGNASVSASRNFGGAPEIGITFGNFRLSAMYHLVAGKDLVTVNVGEPQESIGHSYFVFTLGFRTFSIGD